MGFWLNAWAGDNAGSIVGRQPYRALVAITDAGDFPWEVLGQTLELDGMPWYWMISVACLTPNARSAIVTKVEMIVNLDVASLEITPVKFAGFGDTKVSWEAGVHLFGIQVSSSKITSGLTNTIATVVIPPEIKEVSLSDRALQTMLEMRQRRTVLVPCTR